MANRFSRWLLLIALQFKDPVRILVLKFITSSFSFLNDFQQILATGIARAVSPAAAVAAGIRNSQQYNLGGIVASSGVGSSRTLPAVPTAATAAVTPNPEAVDLAVVSYVSLFYFLS